MKFTVGRDPCPCIIIDDFFSKEENQKILAEGIYNKPLFLKTSKYKNTRLCYTDIHELSEESALLTALWEAVEKEEFIQVLLTFQPPFSYITHFKWREVHVANYHVKDPNAEWHFDYVLDGPMQQITILYWFFKEPRQFKGGSMRLTRSPLLFGRPLYQTDDALNVELKNNRAVIFPSNQGHYHEHLKNNVSFEDGKFSAIVRMGPLG